MEENNNRPPVLRIETENGLVFYPRYVKNTEGKWELSDKSFRKLLERHTVYEKPVKTDKD